MKKKKAAAGKKKAPVEKKKAAAEKKQEKKQFAWWAIAAVAAVVVLAAAVFLSGRDAVGQDADTTLFLEKAGLLRQSAVADWVELELGVNPAGSAGHAVFLSVCDGTRRASVYTGTGKSLSEAWDAAVEHTEAALRKAASNPAGSRRTCSTSPRPFRRRN